MSRKTWIIFVSFVNLSVAATGWSPSFSGAYPALYDILTVRASFKGILSHTKPGTPLMGTVSPFSVFYTCHFPFSFLEFPFLENCSLLKNLLSHVLLSPTCRWGTWPPSLRLCSTCVHCSLTRVRMVLCFVLDFPPGWMILEGRQHPPYYLLLCQLEMK